MKLFGKRKPQWWLIIQDSEHIVFENDRHVEVKGWTYNYIIVKATGETFRVN